MSQSLLLPAGSPVAVPPAGADWLHEIKHERFRLMVRRDGARVLLFTRDAHDWSARYRAIAAAAAALKARHSWSTARQWVADARGVAWSTCCAAAREKREASLFVGV